MVILGYLARSLLGVNISTSWSRSDALHRSAPKQLQTEIDSSMEARLIRAALVAAILCVAMGANYKTPNFVVETGNAELARQFGDAAEAFRHELAISWLGQPMPRWNWPCKVTVRVGPNLGAGGETTFLFNQGEVYGWRMTIQGSRERVLDSVLPHEITHMVFASHFRQALPRWADEGGATSVEYVGELSKHRKMLVEFLHSRRGIAFNRMFSMTEYPRDVMPLYAQGFSLCEFLIRQGGRRKFVAYLGDGLKGDQWVAATERHYGYEGLGPLQSAWVNWVAQGFPELKQPEDQLVTTLPAQTQLATARRTRPEPNLIYHTENNNRDVPPSDFPVVQATAIGRPDDLRAARRAGAGLAAAKPGAPEWHPVDQHSPRGYAGPAFSSQASPEPAPAAIRTQVAHPQPVQRSRQIILEWRRE